MPSRFERLGGIEKGETVVNMAHAGLEQDRVPGKRLDLLGSPVFGGAVLLLLLNDFVLKAAFHNWLTGKLSDLAGMVVLTWIGCAFWPRARWVVAAGTSAFFVYWKSPASEPVLEGLSAWLPVSIDRTVDYSDLIVLPVAWISAAFLPRMRVRGRYAWRVSRWVFGGVAAFALTATTMATTYQRNASFSLRPVTADVEARFAELAALFDGLAEQRGLSPHGPWYSTSGGARKRLYVAGRPGAVHLSIYIDSTGEEASYSLVLRDRKKAKSGWADSLREDVERVFEEHFGGARAPRTSPEAQPESRSGSPRPD